MDEELPAIAILGASGLIGNAVAMALIDGGLRVTPVARRFTPAQAAAFADIGVECPILALSRDSLRRLLDERRIDIVVNCLGLLQDAGASRTDEVHSGFVGRLLDALAARQEPILLIHLSVPGRDEEDRTQFSRTKRDAERLIVAASLPYVILRPGFAVAPAAYGGSALVRALAALPVGLPTREAGRPFATIGVSDIAGTIAIVARRWRRGERQWAVIWDVMERAQSSVGEVVNAFRRRFGGPRPIARVPAVVMDLGATMGDLSAFLGWTPPIRTTALQELRRGVAGDPAPWIAATGIEPTPLESVLARLSATVQEGWFARLYLAKPLIIGTLVLFWIASGLIALTVAFGPATEILTSHGIPQNLAQTVTLASSMIDIAVGLAVAWRRTCRAGLAAGVTVSLCYMATAALITPDLWIEPLGALVKTAPAVVLMIVAMAMLENR